MKRSEDGVSQEIIADNRTAVESSDSPTRRIFHEIVSLPPWSANLLSLFLPLNGLRSPRRVLHRHLLGNKRCRPYQPSIDRLRPVPRLPFPLYSRSVCRRRLPVRKYHACRITPRQALIQSRQRPLPRPAPLAPHPRRCGAAAALQASHHP